MASGTCACGKIKYILTDIPTEATACHCLECRKAFNAPYAPWISVANAALTWSLKPDLVEKSDIAERGYCSGCRTPITMQYFAQPQRVSVSAVGMGVPISEHIFLADKDQDFVVPEDASAKYQYFDPPFEKMLDVWKRSSDSRTGIEAGSTR